MGRPLEDLAQIVLYEDGLFYFPFRECPRCKVPLALAMYTDEQGIRNREMRGGCPECGWIDNNPFTGTLPSPSPLFEPATCYRPNDDMCTGDPSTCPYCSD